MYVPLEMNGVLFGSKYFVEIRNSGTKWLTLNNLYN